MPSLLDTNICIHLINGDFDLSAKLKQVKVENCYLSELSLAELLFGVENSALTRREINRYNVRNFQRLFDDRILPVSGAIETYAVQKAHLRRIGRPQAEFDMLIGSTAIAYKLTLVTRNTRHFEYMTPLKLENWIDNP